MDYLLLMLGWLLLVLLGLAAWSWWRSESRWARPDSPAAVARARSLLRELLTEEDWRQVEQHGWLELNSPTRPGTRYRVHGARRPVEMLEPSGQRRLLCLVPLSPLPDLELVLLHKLWIEADEAEYLRRANYLVARPTPSSQWSERE